MKLSSSFNLLIINANSLFQSSCSESCLQKYLKMTQRISMRFQEYHIQQNEALAAKAGLVGQPRWLGLSQPPQTGPEPVWCSMQLTWIQISFLVHTVSSVFCWNKFLWNMKPLSPSWTNSRVCSSISSCLVKGQFTKMRWDIFESVLWQNTHKPQHLSAFRASIVKSEFGSCSD